MAEENIYKFKRSGSNIDDLLDKVQAGFVYVVDNTKLDFGDIHRRDNKAITQEECDEVINIIEQYKSGKVVVIVNEALNDSYNRFGVLNICTMDDMMPTSLMFYDNEGNLIAYTLDDGPSIGNVWKVVRKTSSYTIAPPLTQAQYDALAVKDEHTLYIITE
ncbi:hypothetical protein [Bacteroides acidifaciens]|uniref:phage upper tail fiber protein n=1 Tax=Bacteroides acidifaciens TaxID=85831 RepID=UPI00158A970D|nr:hypothetical protein [Bacteroides acidifaciens]